MAEAFMRQAAQDRGLDVEVSSAGMALSGPECTLAELLPRSQPFIESMLEKGQDISNYRRRAFTEDMLKDVDYIVSMAEEETEPGDLSSHPVYRRWEIPSPKGMDRQGIDEVRDEIEMNVEALADEIMDSITG